MTSDKGGGNGGSSGGNGGSGGEVVPAPRPVIPGRLQHFILEYSTY